MFLYLLRRIITMIPTLFIISFLVFFIVELPEGDYISNTVAELQAQGEQGVQEALSMRQEYHLDDPMVYRYFYWIKDIVLHGDFGRSMAFDIPVSKIIKSRLLMTIVLSICTIIFIYAVAFPIGVYSAVHQYSFADYSLTFIGFLGLAIPNFLLALILVYLAKVYFGLDIGGLFSAQYIDKPWSFGKFVSLLSHIWIPVVVIGTSGTAGMIRRLRANMLDELSKAYVVTAKAKGLSLWRTIMKYPFRAALNPFIADIGNLLPEVISGSAIVSVVLGLDTTGPMLLKALEQQDTYLAAGFLLMIAFLTVFGMLLSDIALAMLDPRIRLGKGATL